MTAEELATYQEDFTRWARERITGVGADQYSSERGQKFESMPVADLFTYAREELADLVNYATFLDIRLQWLASQLKGMSQ